MALSVNLNWASGAARALGRAQSDADRATQRLSSGLRVNAASDDAAGLAISTRMRAQVGGLAVAARNAQDAVSMAQTAEGGLTSIGANLQRIRELAVQSANATNSASDRAALQAETAQLVDEIDRVARSTGFNGQSLLDGSFGPATFQVGANAGQTIDLSALASMRAAALGNVTPAVVTTSGVTGSTLTAASTITGPGQLVINGVDIWQGTTVNADARDLAAAIGAAGIAGLTASAAANVAVGSWANGPTANGTFEINDGGVISYGYVTGTLDESTANWIIGIFVNAGYAPGLTSSDNGAGVTLSAADGRNIRLNFTGGSPSTYGLGGISYGDGFDGITYSHIGLSYTGTAGLSIAGSKAGALGLPLLTAPPTSSGTTLAAIDLSTVAGANAALGSVDASLSTVDAQRALLGASQNRLSHAITELKSSSADSSAALSRIVDADYASEASELVRAQILQQAGTAMVAQANMQRSQVLQLLKG